MILLPLTLSKVRAFSNSKAGETANAGLIDDEEPSTTRVYASNLDKPIPSSLPNVMKVEHDEVGGNEPMPDVRQLVVNVMSLEGEAEEAKDREDEGHNNLL